MKLLYKEGSGRDGRCYPIKSQECLCLRPLHGEESRIEYNCLSRFSLSILLNQWQSCLATYGTPACKPNSRLADLGPSCLLEHRTMLSAIVPIYHRSISCTSSKLANWPLYSRGTAFTLPRNYKNTCKPVVSKLTVKYWTYVSFISILWKWKYLLADK